ncbi:unnamed protein product [Rotaria socialis]|uniref:G-protein coupled receptors family 1 profile domain-containing protein n=1 Tax=Rotaria socialis TaxID=392032 RepID=A0A820TD16_9BILA|nr:unnamed protein product [Rotaria socialis]CAF4470233.1 unnamed protein product [Rotaria socialis]
MMEWRLGLTALKIGNRYRCSQTDMFADEIRKSVVASHFARSGISGNNSSKDIFRILMTYSKSIEPIFPQLVSLVVFQSLSTSEEGFELKYEHTIMNAYVPHRSLISITIRVLNLTTLHVLLHYLSHLEYLDAYITDVIYSMKTNDEDLPTKLDYPKKLRVLHLSFEYSSYNNSTGTVQNGIPCYCSLNIELCNFYMTSYVWIHLVIMSFLPFGIIMMCTLLTIKKLIIKQTTINDQSLRSAQHKRRTSVILLLMYLAYVICTQGSDYGTCLYGHGVARLKHINVYKKRDKYILIVHICPWISTNNI